MLNYVETAQGAKAYHAVYPDLANLTANLYPELLDVVSFLLYDGKMSADFTSLVNKNFSIPLDELEQVLLKSEDKPDCTLKVLSRLQSTPLKDMQPRAKVVISTLLLPCLESDFDSRIVDAFISTWEYFHLFIPHEIWLWTINTLNTQDTIYEFDDLVKSPLLIFETDQRIFRSERLLLLWLHIRINGRNVMALINAQDSAILQLLLELCQEKKEDRNNQASLLLARKLICRYIHGVFIDDRDNLLTKTLHFQTYAANLIPMMIEYIPSMYIAFNFLPELIRQPQIEKQVFGVLLGCHLCEKYPMESYLALAEKSILPRLMRIAYPSPTSALAVTLNQQQQQSTTMENTRHHQPCLPSEYLLEIIPAFTHLSRAFPHFSPEILNALNDIQQGLPGPGSFISQEGNSKIILLLQLHKTLKETLEKVQVEADRMDDVNKSLMSI
ncbi:integrator complex subunit 2-domain-containing protein [Absidia repens]|uniref:Integrator complex subunit 2-domain-containing protein n=1 Tax=Absidia repens TaxID=90262 RepID=A0A1X2IRE7_9FUNG|nr:integrator complex subunit 2-domain-containing protein [Absidia repens]